MNGDVAVDKKLTLQRLLWHSVEDDWDDIMDTALLEQAETKLGAGNFRKDIQFPMTALVESHQHLIDCTHDYMHAEMDGLGRQLSELQSDSSLATGAKLKRHRLRNQMVLARAQYERSLKRFQLIADEIEGVHGLLCKRWCNDMIKLLETVPRPMSTTVMPALPHGPETGYLVADASSMGHR